MKVSQLGEFGLIDALKSFAPVSKAVIKGIGDDTAVLPYSKSEYLLLTTDMLAEDVHFTRRMPPRSIGHKALACSISDIAAMGGWPTFAVVSIGIPRNLPVLFIKEIYKGIERLAISPCWVWWRKNTWSPVKGPGPGTGSLSQGLWAVHLKAAVT